MTSNELIGKVAASYLRDTFVEDDSSGVARYLLDCLTADQAAAVAKTILADASLYQLIEIKLPVHFVGHHGLPAEILTTERTTYFRNAACDKSALLVANTGDDEEQSLKELTNVGAQELQTHPELWVSIAADGLPIADQHRKWWVKAIQALLEVTTVRARSPRRLHHRDAGCHPGRPTHLVGVGGGAPGAAHSARHGLLSQPE